MKRDLSKVHVLIMLIIAFVLITTVVTVLWVYQSPVSLEIELNPAPPLRVKQGENFSLDISVRNTLGFKAQARHVRGELVLPEGFLEESLQTTTRPFIFGSIRPGDASHYGLTILVSNSIAVGEYNATLTIWGENIVRKTIDIKITVSAS